MSHRIAPRDIYDEMDAADIADNKAFAEDIENVTIIYWPYDSDIVEGWQAVNTPTMRAIAPAEATTIARLAELNKLDDENRFAIILGASQYFCYVTAYVLDGTVNMYQRARPNWYDKEHFNRLENCVYHLLCCVCMRLHVRAILLKCEQKLRDRLCSKHPDAISPTMDGIVMEHKTSLSINEHSELYVLVFYGMPEKARVRENHVFVASGVAAAIGIPDVDYALLTHELCNDPNDLLCTRTIDAFITIEPSAHLLLLLNANYNVVGFASLVQKKDSVYIDSFCVGPRTGSVSPFQTATSFLQWTLAYCHRAMPEAQYAQVDVTPSDEIFYKNQKFVKQVAGTDRLITLTYQYMNHTAIVPCGFVVIHPAKDAQVFVWSSTSGHPLPRPTNAHVRDILPKLLDVAKSELKLRVLDDDCIIVIMLTKSCKVLGVASIHKTQYGKFSPMVPTPSLEYFMRWLTNTADVRAFRQRL